MPIKIIKVISYGKVVGRNRQETAQITYRPDYDNAPVKTKHVRRSSLSSYWTDKDGKTYV